MILIAGYGLSGKAMERFCIENKIQYIIFDENIKDNNIINKVSEVPWSQIKTVVFSSGFPIFPLEHELTERTKIHHIPTYLDVDYFFTLNHESKFIGVTGSMGKTTIHDILTKIFNKAEIKNTSGGNNMISVFHLQMQAPVYLLEISHRMLWFSNSFCCDLGIINNLYNVHQEEGKLNYIFAKSKILRKSNLKNNQIFIVNDMPKGTVETLKLDVQDDCILYVLYDEIHTESDKEKYKNYLFVYNEFAEYKFRNDNRKISIDSKMFPRAGTKNNFGSILATCLIENIPLEIMENVFLNYELIQHRQEFVCKNHNISFFNSSKATNVYAFNQDVNSLNQNAFSVVLMGGKINSDLNEINLKNIENIKLFCVFGQNRSEIEQILKKKWPKVNVVSMEHMKDLVEYAWRYVNNDVEKNVENNWNIMLVPACPSFDQFKNFEERGNVFKEYVRNLCEM